MYWALGHCGAISHPLGGSEGGLGRLRRSGVGWSRRLLDRAGGHSAPGAIMQFEGLKEVPCGWRVGFAAELGGS